MSDSLNQKQFNLSGGSYSINYTLDGVYLTVIPSVGVGKNVDAEDLLNRLSRKQIRDLNREMVETAIMKADKVTVLIAPPQDEVKIDSKATVIIDNNRMNAFISLSEPDGGKNLSAVELLNTLKDNGVVYGVKSTTLESIIRFPIYNEKILIAEGTPPVDGKDGGIKFCFETSESRKPAILEDGRVDYKEMSIVKSIEANQPLCRLLPPVPGVSGKNTAGVEIKARDGKPAVLPKGKNVIISDDGTTLLSAINGEPLFIDGKISVFATYEVLSDVDNSTGNISFTGNIIIRGNVLSGFSIDAGGNIEVWGVVEGASLKASGDIILKRGMQGMGKGTLYSEGDIIARYIEHSTVYSRNNIKAEAIMHSRVRCGNILELSGRKGLLVGGNAKVGKEIIAKVIGSHMNTTTELEVGLDPSIRERYKVLKEENANLDTDIKKADQAISILKKFEAANALTLEKQEMLSKSIKTKLFYTSKIMENNNELSLLESKLQQDACGKVRVQNFIYPGTRVIIGTCLLHVRENLQYCTLYRDGADIRVGPIDK